MSKDKLPYILAKLYPVKPKHTARYYFEFSAYNKQTEQLEKVRVWVPERFKTHDEKRRWGLNEVARVNLMLVAGACFDELKEEKQPVQNPVIIALFPELLEARKESLRPKSYSTLKSVCGKFKTYIIESGNKSLLIGSFKKQHFEGFIDYLLSVGNNAVTINNQAEKVGWFFNQAINKGYIEKKPYTFRKLPETEQIKNVAFTRSHQTVLEAYLLDNNYPLYLFTRLIYHAFIRPRELRNLKVLNLDFERRTILVPGTISKNRKNEYVPINRTLFELLKVFEGKDGYLFGKSLELSSKTKTSENTPYNHHAAALKAVGLTGLGYSLYSWKHTGAVRAYESGLDIKKLQAILRHSSLQITDIYLRSLNVIQDVESLAGW